MFTYENGLILSALFYLYYLISLVISINSQLEKNLNKVGERMSWLTLTPKMMTSVDIQRSTTAKFFKFIFIVVWQGFFVFLSWINVLINLVAIIYRVSKDKGAPREVREFRWKLRNRDLTFDEMIREIIKVNGLNEADFEKIKQSKINDLIEVGVLQKNIYD